jgi:hypothetical protein
LHVNRDCEAARNLIMIEPSPLFFGVHADNRDTELVAIEIVSQTEPDIILSGGALMRCVGPEEAPGSVPDFSPLLLSGQCLYRVWPSDRRTATA